MPTHTLILSGSPETLPSSLIDNMICHPFLGSEYSDAAAVRQALQALPHQPSLIIGGQQTPASLYHCYSQPSGHETLYIHDMVVSAKARGRGIARAFLRHLEQLARQKAQQEMSLVAVQGADRYWASVGFRPRAPGKSLAQYGDNAVYMWRPLESPKG